MLQIQSGPAYFCVHIDQIKALVSSGDLSLTHAQQLTPVPLWPLLEDSPHVDD